jgi:hypothetical protein
VIFDTREPKRAPAEADALTLPEKSLCNVRDLAAMSRIHRNAISNIEVGHYNGAPETMAAIKKPFEAAGVEFTNGKKPGVRLGK